jgi:hypothetical protein
MRADGFLRPHVSKSSGRMKSFTLSALLQAIRAYLEGAGRLLPLKRMLPKSAFLVSALVAKSRSRTCSLDSSFFVPALPRGIFGQSIGAAALSGTSDGSACALATVLWSLCRYLSEKKQANNKTFWSLCRYVALQGVTLPSSRLHCNLQSLVDLRARWVG